MPYFSEAFYSQLDLINYKITEGIDEKTAVGVSKLYQKIPQFGLLLQ